ncbi:MAG: sigma-70 family RNA polymerase sigma factor [Bacteroidales bacterium]|nr:sigma-70 family RNA polymerase sigma factor [Bacteroidales bacterium]
MTNQLEDPDIPLIKPFIDTRDKRSFNLLIEKYQHDVYSFCYRFLGDEPDASDCSQEIFIRIYKHLPGFNYRAKFSTWLYRIMVNACNDMVKSRKYRTKQVSFDVEAPFWLEAGIWQAIDSQEHAPPISSAPAGKIILLRTLSVAAAILILAFLVIPTGFYMPNDLETSFSFHIEKKSKGPGKSRFEKNANDPRMLLFRELIDSVGGEILEEGYRQESGQADFIRVKLPVRRYPEFREKLKEMKMGEDLPETLPWSPYPYVKIKVWFPGQEIRHGRLQR